MMTSIVDALLVRPPAQELWFPHLPASDGKVTVPWRLRRLDVCRTLSLD
jgi:hypothetical protein